MSVCWGGDNCFECGPFPTVGEGEFANSTCPENTHGDTLLVSADDDFITISVEDNAGGIPEDILSDVFKANVTSKGEKGGTGIGLYMSNEIVTKHLHGELKVTNENISLEIGPSSISIESGQTITLPSSPSVGDTVRVFDANKTFDSTACTIARNGERIMGDTADMTVDSEGASFDLIYSGTAQGWRLLSV